MLTKQKIVFLIAEGGSEEDQKVLVRTKLLRDEIRDESSSDFGAFELIGPKRDSDPRSWSPILRELAAPDVVLVIASHGGTGDGHYSLGIASDGDWWTPKREAAHLEHEHPLYRAVLVDACWGPNQLEDLEAFFARGQRFILCNETAYAGDCERVIKPFLRHLIAGGPVDAKVEDFFQEWEWRPHMNRSAKSLEAWYSTAGAI